MDAKVCDITGAVYPTAEHKDEIKIFIGESDTSLDLHPKLYKKIEAILNTKNKNSEEMGGVIRKKRKLPRKIRKEKVKKEYGTPSGPRKKYHNWTDKDTQFVRDNIEKDAKWIAGKIGCNQLTAQRRLTEMKKGIAAEDKEYVHTKESKKRIGESRRQAHERAREIADETGSSYRDAYIQACKEEKPKAKIYCAMCQTNEVKKENEMCSECEEKFG